jgi:hypothetical protein
MESLPTDPVSTAPKGKWRPKWPSVVTPALFISLVSLALSLGNAYLTMVLRHDEIQAIWPLHGPSMSIDKDRTLQIHGEFSISIFNVGNRSAIVSDVTAFIIPGENCKPSGRDGFMVIKLDYSAITLKPGEASTVRLKMASTEPKAFKSFSIGNYDVCLKFTTFTPSGMDFHNFRHSSFHLQNQIPIDEKFSLIGYLEAGTTEPVVIYRRRWPFN